MQTTCTHGNLLRKRSAQLEQLEIQTKKKLQNIKTLPVKHYVTATLPTVYIGKNFMDKISIKKVCRILLFTNPYKLQVQIILSQRKFFSQKFHPTKIQQLEYRILLKVKFLRIYNLSSFSKIFCRLRQYSIELQSRTKN